MKSSLCHIKKQTASLRFVGLMLTITSLGLMLALADRSAQAQTSADVSSATTSAAPSPADWTQFLRDNMQRWNPYETVLGVNNVGSLQLKSRFSIGGKFGNSSPAIVNGVIYATSSDGALLALKVGTGEKLWINAAVNAFSGPAVANGIVYVGSADDNVYALSADTGAVVWKYRTGYRIFSSPTVASEVVYIGSEDFKVYALNAKTGARLWSYSTAGVVNSSPAVSNGMVYAGSGDGYMYALDASTGSLIWRYLTAGGKYSTTPNGIYSSAAVANGSVYFSGGDRFVYGLNAKTGALIWQFNTGLYSTGSSPAVADGVVYVTGPVGNAFALNATTGAKLWEYLIDPNYTDGLTASPAVANGIVYISSPNTSGIYALDAKGGALLWSYFGAGFFPANSVEVVDGAVYCTATEGQGSFVYGFSVGADLNLRAIASLTPVRQGDLLTYTFPVWNLGTDNAVHEVLNTQVPEGTTFDYIRISGTPGLGTCTHPPYQGTGQIVCHENGSMAPNTTWTVRLTVRVTAPSGTVITENAATLADTPDPNPANNTATVSIKVQ